MFSGIIEKLGKVESLKIDNETVHLILHIDNLNYSIGDSVCVNGVCLTVESFKSYLYEFCVSPETSKITSLSNLKQGDFVNIESSLTIEKYISGHLVQGHVDTQAVLIGITKIDSSWKLDFEISKDYLKYIIKKGSIAIDGVSLTVNDIEEDGFSIMIIPHTFENTIIQNYKLGEKVNIELDIVGKYIEKLGKIYG